MSDSALPGYALRYLRALGHVLKPVIQVGKEGQTEGLVEATRLALLDHELIKVKVLTEAPVERHEVGRALAEATGAVLAQVVGRTFLLYRRHPKKPRIQLPNKASIKKAAKKKAKDAARSLEVGGGGGAAAEAMREMSDEGESGVRAPTAAIAAERGRRKEAPAPAERGAKPRGARRAYSAKLKGTSRRTNRGRR